MGLTGRTAAGILAGLLSLVTVFHLLVLLQLIPYNAVWAGRLTNDGGMYVYESVSLLLNLILLFVVLQKGRLTRRRFPLKVLDAVLYGFAILFFVNTIGNMFAVNVLERTLGAALTLISSYLCWRVAKWRGFNN